MTTLAWVVLAPLALVTLVGLVLLWPSASESPEGPSAARELDGVVIAVEPEDCPADPSDGSPAPAVCGTVTVELEEAEAGSNEVEVAIPDGPGAPGGEGGRRSGRRRRRRGGRTDLRHRRPAAEHPAVGAPSGVQPRAHRFRSMARRHRADRPGARLRHPARLHGARHHRRGTTGARGARCVPPRSPSSSITSPTASRSRRRSRWWARWRHSR